MDKKKFIMPLAGMIGAVLIVLLLTFPMLSMQPKNIPIGIVSLDKGITTPNGNINAGDTFVKNIVKADNKLLDFKKVKSEKNLNKNLVNGKYYATILIPKDFTKNSMQKNGKINVTINEGLNPMVTMQLSSALSMMGKDSEINFDIKSINSVTSLGMKAMLIPMISIMMTFITSLITAFLVTINIKDKNKGKSYLKQLLYLLVVSFIIGFTVSALVISIASVDIKIVKPALYLTLVSFALMLLVNGSVNLLGKKGLIIPILLFILGMGTVQLPYEYLNEVWQVLVASWEPFRYIGNGIREVLYQNKDILNSATLSLVIIGVIGIILSIISIYNKKER